MVHASEKKGGIAILFFFLIIYIIVPLYRRKFSNGHIILISNVEENYFSYKEKTILMSKKYNHKREKEINLLFFRRFPMKFLNIPLNLKTFTIYWLLLLCFFFSLTLCLFPVDKTCFV